MKSFYKLLLVVSVLVFTVSAQAGQQYRYQSQSVYGDNGSGGSFYLSAYRYCNEFPDGIGGTVVDGFAQVNGYINNNYVEESESYYGLSSCPDFGGFKGKPNQTIAIVVGGISVTAECTNQTTSKSSGNGQTKSPGQKPQNYTSHSKYHYTTDGYDGSCVITALDTAGPPEKFGNYASAYSSEDFQNYNR